MSLVGSYFGRFWPRFFIRCRLRVSQWIMNFLIHFLKRLGIILFIFQIQSLDHDRFVLWISRIFFFGSHSPWTKVISWYFFNFKASSYFITQQFARMCRCIWLMQNVRFALRCRGIFLHEVENKASNENKSLLAAALIEFQMKEDMQWTEQDRVKLLRGDLIGLASNLGKWQFFIRDGSNTTYNTHYSYGRFPGLPTCKRSLNLPTTNIKPIIGHLVQSMKSMTRHIAFPRVQLNPFRYREIHKEYWHSKFSWFLFFVLCENWVLDP